MCRILFLRGLLGRLVVGLLVIDFLHCYGGTLLDSAEDRALLWHLLLDLLCVTCLVVTVVLGKQVLPDGLLWSNLRHDGLVGLHKLLVLQHGTLRKVVVHCHILLLIAAVVALFALSLLIEYLNVHVPVLLGSMVHV